MDGKDKNVNGPNNHGRITHSWDMPLSSHHNNSYTGTSPAKVNTVREIYLQLSLMVEVLPHP
jgi:hypothetical protein